MCNGYYGMQAAINLLQKLNALEFASLSNEININAGGKPIFANAQIQKIKEGNSPDLCPDNDLVQSVCRQTKIYRIANVTRSAL
uniref:hypothetical protein n=1 Tax=Ornithobacterium rhinotracheale TaxID=28251 RepID=UPI0039A742AE